MTSSVVVHAHCSEEKEVILQILDMNECAVKEEIILQNGERAERCIYGDLAVRTFERLKIASVEVNTAEHTQAAKGVTEVEIGGMKYQSE